MKNKEKTKLVDDLVAKGHSIAEACKEIKMVPSTYYYWAKNQKPRVEVTALPTKENGVYRKSSRGQVAMVVGSPTMVIEVLRGLQ